MAVYHTFYSQFGLKIRLSDRNGHRFVSGGFGFFGVTEPTGITNIRGTDIDFVFTQRGPNTFKVQWIAEGRGETSAFEAFLDPRLGLDLFQVRFREPEDASVDEDNNLYVVDAEILLTWNKNLEPDLDFYAIYRSFQADFNPDTLAAYEYNTSDTFFTDNEFPSEGTYYYRLTAFDIIGNESGYSEAASATVVGIELEPNIPKSFSLEQNYPNPFNPITVLRYALPRSSAITLVVYNLKGQEVIRWDEGNAEPGFYEITWNGTNRLGIPVASGIYIYRLIASDFIQTKKMVLLK